MIPRVLPPGKSDEAESAVSALDLGVSNIVLVDARSAFHGEGIVLHLRELDGKATDLRWAEFVSIASIKSIDEVSVLEEILKPKIATLTFAPYDSKFFKMTLK